VSPHDLAILPILRGSIATGSRFDTPPSPSSNRNYSDIVACEPCRDARRPVRVLVMSRRDPIPALEQQLGAELARLLIGWNADDVAS